MEECLNLANRINELIKELNLTKKAFAESIKVSPTSITDWLNPNKKSNPSSNALRMTGKIYNVNLNWLLNGVEPMFFDHSIARKPCNREYNITIIKKKLDETVSEKESLKNELASFAEALKKVGKDRDRWQKSYNDSLVKIIELQDEIIKLKEKLIQLFDK